MFQHFILFMNRFRLHRYTQFSLPIHQLMDLQPSLALSIVNDAAVNIHVEFFARTYVFISPRQIARIDIAESGGIPTFFDFYTCHTSFYQHPVFLLLLFLIRALTCFSLFLYIYLPLLGYARHYSCVAQQLVQSQQQQLLVRNRDSHICLDLIPDFPFQSGGIHAHCSGECCLLRLTNEPLPQELPLAREWVCTGVLFFLPRGSSDPIPYLCKKPKTWFLAFIQDIS